MIARNQNDEVEAAVFQNRLDQCTRNDGKHFEHLDIFIIILKLYYHHITFID